MKKLYNTNNKGTKRIHPSPLPPSTSILLSALPTALLALATALSAEDQEVLAYLLSCQQKPNEARPGPHGKQRPTLKANGSHHSPELGCSCFTCYKSFWARWDASPNRHVIDLIIDTFEETLESKEKKDKSSRKKKKKRTSTARLMEKKGDDSVVLQEEIGVVVDGHDGDDDDDEEEEEEEEKGREGERKSSVSRFVSWVFGINNNN